MNKDNFNENLLQEECKKINEKLKETENFDLPEGLNPENVAKKLGNIKQDNIQELKATSNKGKKRRIKKYVIGSVATAAAFVIAVTSIMTAKPWETDTVVKPQNNQVKVEDYSEIEQLFSQYSDNFKKYQAKQTVDDAVEFFTFGIGSMKVMESGVLNDTNASASVDSGMSSSVTAQSNHGETYEQVQGVSEADIIKNDGEYLYVVKPSNADWIAFEEAFYSEYEKTTQAGEQSTPGYDPSAETDTDDAQDKSGTQTTFERNSKGLPVLKYECGVSVVKPEKNGKMKEIATVNVEKPEDEDIYYMEMMDMYVTSNKIIAVVNCYKYGESSENSISAYNTYYGKSYFYSHGGIELTMAVCFDITDKNAPVEEWRFYQDGEYISSRLIGNQFVVLSSYYVDITDDKEIVIDNCVPTFACGNEEMKRISVGDVCVMEGITDTSYLFATTLDINDENSVKNQAVLGAGKDVYCTTENLYAVSTRYKNEGVVGEVFGVTTYTTKVYKFDIRNYNISYLGCGEVEGYTLNQFSIDEYNGYLRIATSTGNWGENISNRVYVLDSDLNVVGKIEGIAKGETIKSVRFNGDTGYVVTFEQTDPLFVIDLSNPEKPKVKGELKIPGFSTYLHPVGENLVLGVGVDGDENGQTNGMKVSLFDVSDPENPIECDKITIDGLRTDNAMRYISSAAYYTHKALCWDGTSNTMYIPYGKSNRYWGTWSNEGFSSKDVAGILAVSVDENAKKLSQAADYLSNSTEFKNSADFSRATYIDNVIFGYSENDGLLISFDKNTQKQLYSLSIG